MNALINENPQVQDPKTSTREEPAPVSSTQETVAAIVRDVAPKDLQARGGE